MIEIVQARSEAELDDVRMLIRAFIDWARVRLAEDAERVNRYFDARSMDRELATLSRRYAPPRGSLLVAHDEGRPVGCVGMVDLGDGICEMKRMFVAAEARGKGLGRRLVERLIVDARAAGYRAMRLNNSPYQPEATALYLQSGFQRIPRYCDMPDDLKDWLRYYELKL